MKLGGGVSYDDSEVFATLSVKQLEYPRAPNVDVVWADIASERPRSVDESFLRTCAQCAAFALTRAGILASLWS